MNSAIFETGTEMSHLIEPPSGRCESDSSSRSFQKAARWLSDWAMAASSTSSFSKPSASRASMVSPMRSEEHTSELQSLMRISYAVFCLNTKNDDSLNTHNYSNK